VSTYPSWTLIDVPTTDSILIYSHFVQTVSTRRLPSIEEEERFMRRGVSFYCCPNAQQ
jgi:hypothetical protein